MGPAAQTIFALSSGRVPAAIAVVRMSGPQAGQALTALVGRLPEPRRAMRSRLKARSGEMIDDAVALWFPAPASATGEDVAELHVHGSRAVLAALFAELAVQPGLRPAEPGEFTRQAFENGKIDLTEAEGLDDLIHADTDVQRRLALRQMEGLLGERARDWRARLIAIGALLEADIDFSDEGDVPDDLAGPALERIAGLRAEIAAVLGGGGRSERLRGGMVVAIVGAPNVGKSTLMNRLVQREVAIVSPIAGTTRDVIEVQLDIGGYPVTLVDTAGLRDSDDPVEQEGVRRARARAGQADLVLWLATGKDEDGDGGLEPAFQAPVWRIGTKSDLVSAGDAGEDVSHRISAASGAGIEPLLRDIANFAAEFFQVDQAVMTRERHRAALAETFDALGRADAAASRGIELLAEEVRLAQRALGRLLGRIDVEDVLDTIFRDFCIGK